MSLVLHRPLVAAFGTLAVVALTACGPHRADAPSTGAARVPQTISSVPVVPPPSARPTASGTTSPGVTSSPGGTHPAPSGTSTPPGSPASPGGTASTERPATGTAPAPVSTVPVPPGSGSPIAGPRASVPPSPGPPAATAQDVVSLAIRLGCSSPVAEPLSRAQTADGATYGTDCTASGVRYQVMGARDTAAVDRLVLSLAATLGAGHEAYIVRGPTYLVLASTDNGVTVSLPAAQHVQSVLGGVIVRVSG